MTKFDCFVIIAEMRTGSNFLESNLNSMLTIECFGEAFNQNFVGYPVNTDILGISREDRDKDPRLLYNAIKSREGRLGGFRYFGDHDPRVVDLIIDDRRCAKIILTRNPVESYVSRKIAIRTGQWKLTNARRAKTAKIMFDAADFADYLQRLEDFQTRIRRRLQITGQTAFFVDYEELFNVDVVNGIADFLGVDERLKSLDTRLKKQNPGLAVDKVLNRADMLAALGQFSSIGIKMFDNPGRRYRNINQGWIGGARSPILFRNTGHGPAAVIREWMTRLDGGEVPAEGFTQDGLTSWKEKNAGFRSFAVVRHPLVRAHRIFQSCMFGDASESLARVGQIFRQRSGLDGLHEVSSDSLTYKEAFKAFLVFLGALLNGQTNLRVERSMVSQLTHIQGIARDGPPDLILREEELCEGLALVLWQIRREVSEEVSLISDPGAGRLAEIVDDDIEELARIAYLQDYLAFGFGKWQSSIHAA